MYSVRDGVRFKNPRLRLRQMRIEGGPAEIEPYVAFVGGPLRYQRAIGAGERYIAIPPKRDVLEQLLEEREPQARRHDPGKRTVGM